jgi:hypothetical protein
MGRRKIEYGFDPSIGHCSTWDTVLATEHKSPRGKFSREFALWLRQKGIRTRYFLEPGIGETCPVDTEGIFYMNPSPRGIAASLIIGQNVRKIPNVENVWYFWLDQKREPNLMPIDNRASYGYG